MKTNFVRLMIVLCFGTLFLNSSFAQGDLLITPRRLVFEGNKRADQINLANTGNDTATYVVSFVQIRMNEDGTFQNITQPDSNQYFASNFLRFFPRTVTLGPKEAQTIKVQLTKTNELTQGEYRSHIYFRAVPKQRALGSETKEDSAGISVKLVPIFGISIPVIIHHGESNARVNISDAAVLQPDSLPSVNFNFNRTGNTSVYGDIDVHYIAPSGKSTLVANVRGIAVYTPTPKRQMNILLKKVDNINYHSGKLHIEYYQSSPKKMTLAETDVPLQ